MATASVPESSVASSLASLLQQDNHTILLNSTSDLKNNNTEFMKTSFSSSSSSSLSSSSASPIPTNHSLLPPTSPSTFTVQSPRGNVVVHSPDLQKYSEATIIEATVLTELWHALNGSHSNHPPPQHQRNSGSSSSSSSATDNNNNHIMLIGPEMDTLGLTAIEGLLSQATGTAIFSDHSFSSSSSSTSSTMNEPKETSYYYQAISLHLAREMEGIFNHYSTISAGDALNGRLLSSLSWRKFIKDCSLTNGTRASVKTLIADMDLLYTRCVRGEGARYGIFHILPEEKGLTFATFIWALCRLAIYFAPVHLLKSPKVHLPSGANNVLINADKSTITELLVNLLRLITPAKRLHIVGNGNELLEPDMVLCMKKYAGLLRTLFLGYAKGFGVPTAHSDGAVLPLKGLVQLASDFSICPGVISKARLFSIFITVNPSRSPLLFAGFIEVFGRIALVAYSLSPAIHESFPTPLSKLEALFDRIRSCHHLTKLREEERSRGLVPIGQVTNTDDDNTLHAQSTHNNADNYHPLNLLGTISASSATYSPGAGMRKLIAQRSLSNTVSVRDPQLSITMNDESITRLGIDTTVSPRSPSVLSPPATASSLLTVSTTTTTSSSIPPDEIESALREENVPVPALTTNDLSSTTVTPLLVPTSITDVASIAKRRGGSLLTATTNSAAIAASPDTAIALQRSLIHSVLANSNGSPNNGTVVLSSPSRGRSTGNRTNVNSASKVFHGEPLLTAAVSRLESTPMVPPTVVNRSTNSLSSTSKVVLPTGGTISNETLQAAAEIIASAIQSAKTSAQTSPVHKNTIDVPDNETSKPSALPVSYVGLRDSMYALPDSVDTSLASSRASSIAPSYRTSRAHTPSQHDHHHAGMLPLPSSHRIHHHEHNQTGHHKSTNEHSHSHAHHTTKPSPLDLLSHSTTVPMVPTATVSPPIIPAPYTARRSTSLTEPLLPSSSVSNPSVSQDGSQTSFHYFTEPIHTVHNPQLHVSMQNRFGGKYGPFKKVTKNDVVTKVKRASSQHSEHIQKLVDEDAVANAAKLAGKPGFRKGFVRANSQHSSSSSSSSSSRYIVNGGTNVLTESKLAPHAIPEHVTKTLQAASLGVPVTIPVPLMQQTIAANIIAAGRLSSTRINPQTLKNDNPKPIPKPLLNSKKIFNPSVDEGLIDLLCTKFAPLLPRLRPIFLFYCRIGDPGNTGRMNYTNFYTLLRDIDVLDEYITTGVIHIQLSMIAQYNAQQIQQKLFNRAVKQENNIANVSSNSSSSSSSASSSGGVLLPSAPPMAAGGLTLDDFLEALIRVSELVRVSAENQTEDEEYFTKAEITRAYNSSTDFLLRRILPLLALAAADDAAAATIGTPEVIAPLIEHTDFLIRLYSHYCTPLASTLQVTENTAAEQAVGLFLREFNMIMKDFEIIPTLVTTVEIQTAFYVCARRNGTDFSIEGRTGMGGISGTGGTPGLSTGPRNHTIVDSNMHQRNYKVNPGESKHASSSTNFVKGTVSSLQATLPADATSRGNVSDGATTLGALERDPHSAFLTFPAFIEAVARIALIGFSRTYLDNRHPTVASKVLGLIAWMQASRENNPKVSQLRKGRQGGNRILSKNQLLANDIFLSTNTDNEVTNILSPFIGIVDLSLLSPEFQASVAYNAAELAQGGGVTQEMVKAGSLIPVHRNTTTISTSGSTIMLMNHSVHKAHQTIGRPSAFGGNEDELLPRHTVSTNPLVPHGSWRNQYSNIYNASISNAAGITTSSLLFSYEELVQQALQDIGVYPPTNDYSPSGETNNNTEVQATDETTVDPIHFLVEAALSTINNSLSPGSTATGTANNDSPPSTNAYRAEALELVASHLETAGQFAMASLLRSNNPTKGAPTNDAEMTTTATVPAPVVTTKETKAVTIQELPNVMIESAGSSVNGSIDDTNSFGRKSKPFRKSKKVTEPLVIKTTAKSEAMAELGKFRAKLPPPFRGYALPPPIDASWIGKDGLAKEPIVVASNDGSNNSSVVDNSSSAIVPTTEFPGHNAPASTDIPVFHKGEAAFYARLIAGRSSITTKDYITRMRPGLQMNILDSFEQSRLNSYETTMLTNIAGLEAANPLVPEAPNKLTWPAVWRIMNSTGADPITATEVTNLVQTNYDSLSIPGSYGPNDQQIMPSLPPSESFIDPARLSSVIDVGPATTVALPVRYALHERSSMVQALRDELTVQPLLSPHSRQGIRRNMKSRSISTTASSSSRLGTSGIGGGRSLMNGNVSGILNSSSVIKDTHSTVSGQNNNNKGTGTVSATNTNGSSSINDVFVAGEALTKTITKPKSLEEIADSSTVNGSYMDLDTVDNGNTLPSTNANGSPDVDTSIDNTLTNNQDNLTMDDLRPTLTTKIYTTSTNNNATIVPNSAMVGINGRMTPSGMHRHYDVDTGVNVSPPVPLQGEILRQYRTSLRSPFMTKTQAGTSSDMRIYTNGLTGGASTLHKWNYTSAVATGAQLPGSQPPPIIPSPPSASPLTVPNSHTSSSAGTGYEPNFMKPTASRIAAVMAEEEEQQQLLNQAIALGVIPSTTIIAPTASFAASSSTSFAAVNNKGPRTGSTHIHSNDIDEGLTLLAASSSSVKVSNTGGNSNSRLASSTRRQTHTMSTNTRRPSMTHRLYLPSTVTGKPSIGPQSENFHTPSWNISNDERKAAWDNVLVRDTEDNRSLPSNMLDTVITNGNNNFNNLSFTSGTESQMTQNSTYRSVSSSRRQRNDHTSSSSRSVPSVHRSPSNPRSLHNLASAATVDLRQAPAPDLPDIYALSPNSMVRLFFPDYHGDSHGDTAFRGRDVVKLVVNNKDNIVPTGNKDVSVNNTNIIPPTVQDSSTRSTTTLVTNPSVLSPGSLSVAQALADAQSILGLSGKEALPGMSMESLVKFQSFSSSQSSVTGEITNPIPSKSSSSSSTSSSSSSSSSSSINGGGGNLSSLLSTVQNIDQVISQVVAAKNTSSSPLQPPKGSTIPSSSSSLPSSSSSKNNTDTLPSSTKTSLPNAAVNSSVSKVIYTRTDDDDDAYEIA